jgi:hypothetical protein
MKKKVSREFVTADLYLASAFRILLNRQPDFRVEDGRTLFIYPVNEDLYKAMNDYNNGVAINAFEYAQTIKRLRGEMLMRRAEGRNG